MQVHLSKQMLSVQLGYLDPQLIAQTMFNYPRDWKLEGKELTAGTTIEEKEKIWQTEIMEASLRVAAYISIAFRNLQNNSAIWLPYNFE